VPWLLATSARVCFSVLQQQAGIHQGANSGVRRTPLNQPPGAAGSGPLLIGPCAANVNASAAAFAADVQMLRGRQVREPELLDRLDSSLQQAI
jgi:hypothetical protein